MRVAESPLRDMLRLVVWYPLRWSVLALPPRAGLWLLRRLGDVHWLASRGKKRHIGRCLDNLGLGLSETDKRREVRTFFQTHYVNQLSIFIFPKLTRERLSEFLEFEGLDRLVAARKAGRGAVVVLGHFGPTQAPLAGLGRMGFAVKQIGYPTDEGLSWIGRRVAFRLRLVYEGKIPAEIVRPGADLRGVMRHLAASGLVMATGDGEGAGRRFGKYDSFAFFGRQVDFPLGPARLAQKSGALLFPLRLEPGKAAPFRAVIGPALNADGEGDPHILTGRFLEEFTASVAARPGWWHFLERFLQGGFLSVP
jgi:phosphatidylinositol dimannoside acyltransferase